ncbi:hypothetical protein Btru_069276 [Bulinus truncatus]|nr:hypothetical protein Btru_069276 [Bulinus truncatus]
MLYWNTSVTNAGCDTEAEASSEIFLVPDEVAISRMFQLLVNSILSGLISVSGIVTNAICAVVFIKQGGKDSVNLPLLAMSVAYILCDVMMLWCCIWNLVVYSQARPLPVEPVGFNAMTGYLPRIVFFRVVSWLMAFAALQRCVCVAMPLKVKVIFTPFRTGVMTLCLSLVAFHVHLTIYISRELRLTFDPEVNLTQLTMVIIPEALSLSFLVNQILFVFLPLVNFMLIVSCTLVLVYKLNASMRWRDKMRSARGDLKCPSTGDAQDERDVEKSARKKRNKLSKKSTKELRMTRMVATTTAIFVACTLPSNAAIVYGTVVEGENLAGDYLHLLAFLLETLNSTVALLVYFKMSANFRDTARTVMRCRNNKLIKGGTYS